MGIAYNPNIPSTNDDPADDQPQMLTNFASINTWTNVDHLPFANPNYGRHKQVNIPTPLGSDPVIGGTTGVVYTKTIAAATQLFFENASTVTQLTGFISSIATPGYTTLPGGLIIQWGSKTASISGAISYPLAYPNNSFLVLATVRSTSANIFISTFNTAGSTGAALTQFNYILSASSDFSWIGLGN